MSTQNFRSFILTWAFLLVPGCAADNIVGTQVAYSETDAGRDGPLGEALDEPAPDSTAPMAGLDGGSDGAGDTNLPVNAKKLTPVSARAVGIGHLDAPTLVAATDDGGVVIAATGSYRGTDEGPPPAALDWTLAVVKLDATGAMSWMGTFGPGRGARFHSLAVDSQGNMVLAGTFSSPLSFGGNLLTTPGMRQDIFLVKLDREGRHVFSRQFAGQGASGSPFSVAVDGSDHIVVTGVYDGSRAGADVLARVLADETTCRDRRRFVARFAPEGQPLWARCFERADRATVDRDGNLYVADGAAVVRIALSTYQETWSRTVDGLNWNWNSVDGDQMAALVSDGLGGLAVTGRIGGRSTAQGDLPRYDDFRAVVARFRAGGELAWKKEIASTGDFDKWRVPDAEGRSIAVGGAGDLWVTGAFSGTVDFGGGPLAGTEFIPEGFVAGFGPEGQHLGSVKLPAGGDSLTVTSDGHVVVVGRFQGTVRFGETTLARPSDGFIVRLSP